MKQWIVRHEECIRRSAKTFLQAAVGVFTTAIASGEFLLAEWKTWVVTLGGSAVAAGIAAVMNVNKDKQEVKGIGNYDQ